VQNDRFNDNPTPGLSQTSATYDSDSPLDVFLFFVIKGIIAVIKTENPVCKALNCGCKRCVKIQKQKPFLILIFHISLVQKCTLHEYWPTNVF